MGWMGWMGWLSLDGAIYRAPTVLISGGRIVLRSSLDKDGTKKPNAAKELFEKVAIFDIE